MPKMLVLVVLLIVLCLGASIGYFNAQPVEFYYLVGSIKLPLIALIVGIFLSGVALTLLLTVIRILGLKGEVRRLRRQLNDVEVELKNLRNLPVAQEPPR
jgi:putative membrane protein